MTNVFAFPLPIPDEELDMAALDEISRAIGRIEQSVEDIKSHLKTGDARFEEHDYRMKVLEAAEDKRSGGWGVVLALAGAGGMFIGWLVNWFK